MLVEIYENDKLIFLIIIFLSPIYNLGNDCDDGNKVHHKDNRYNVTCDMICTVIKGATYIINHKDITNDHDDHIFSNHCKAVTVAYIFNYNVDSDDYGNAFKRMTTIMTIMVAAMTVTTRNEHVNDVP